MGKLRNLQKRKSNPNLIRLIDKLLLASAKNKVRIWKDIAERLSKSSKFKAEVNVGKIERYINENEIALIPGKVLGSGDISKPITVAALNFSETAREKITKAGGKCISIEELIEINPEGSNVRILI